MIPIVPHLQTFSFVIPQDTVVVLPADKHRTFFSIGKQVDRKDDITHVWIGKSPPPNQASWIPLSDDTSLSLTFPHGVYGPIGIAVDGAGEGSVLIISNLDEAKFAEAIEVVVPVWSTVPDYTWTQRVDEPFTMDMNDYITAGLPILSWETTAPGIMTGSILSIPSDTAPGDHSITVTAFNTKAPAGVPSNTFTWTVAIPLAGSSLNSIGAIQAGAIIDIGYILDGDAVESIGEIQSGSIPYATYTLQGTGVNSIGAIKSGAIPSVAMALEGTAVNSIGEILAGTASGVPVWTDTPSDQESAIGDPEQEYDMKPLVTSDAGTLDTWELVPANTDGFAIDPDTGVITVTPDAT
jgi:hypothetical protein